MVRNLPAEDARTMGADLVICVDVSERVSPVDSLHSLIDIVDQTVAFRVQASNMIERPLCNVVIDPDVSGITSLAFGQAEMWIARGRAAANVQRTGLQALADSVHRVRGALKPRRTLPQGDSVFIHSVSWSRVSGGADALVRGSIHLDDDTWMSERAIAAIEARVFATGRFDQVSYRIVPHGRTNDLVFDLAEGDRDVLGIGVHYDTPRGVSLLMNASVADWLAAGSSASASARLGEEEQFDVRNVFGELPSAPVLQTYRATFTHTPMTEFGELGALGPLTLDTHELAAEFARGLTKQAQIGLEIAHDWSNDGTKVTDPVWGGGPLSYTTVALTLHVDSYDQSFMPTRGVGALWRSEYATRDLGSSTEFSRHFLDAGGAYRVTSDVSVEGHLTLGYAGGTNLPIHDHFFLGGSVPSTVWPTQFVPFLGLDPQSRSGTSVEVWQGACRLTSLRICSSPCAGMWAMSLTRGRGCCTTRGISAAPALPWGRCFRRARCRSRSRLRG